MKETNYQVHSLIHCNIFVCVCVRARECVCLCACASVCAPIQSSVVILCVLCCWGRSDGTVIRGLCWAGRFESNFHLCLWDVSTGSHPSRYMCQVWAAPRLNNSNQLYYYAAVSRLLQDVRNFAHRWDKWLATALEKLPDMLKEKKIAVSQRFSQSLKRQTSFLHLAQVGQHMAQAGV